MTERAPPIRILVPRDQWQRTLEEHKVRAWYMALGLVPRAFRLPGRIFVREDQKDNLELQAHELGHDHGHSHPPRFSFANLLDVMGESPIRVLDRYGLKPKARAWLSNLPEGSS